MDAGIKMLLRFRLLILLALSLLVSAPAFAQEQAAAEALFRSAHEAAEQGDWLTACDRFEESNRLDPAPGTVLNIARCREELGQLASAWKRYQEAAERLPESDKRAKYAARKTIELEPQVPLVTFYGPDQEAVALDYQLFVNEVEFAPAMLGVALPFDPGKLRVVLKARGREDSVVILQLKKAQKLKQQLAFGAPLAEETVDGEAKSARPESATVNRTPAYVLLGIAGAGLGAAVGGGIWAAVELKKTNAHCDDGRCDQTGADASARGRSAVILLGVGAGVGVIAASLGSYFLLRSPKKSVSLSPHVGGGMLKYSQSF